MFTVPLRLIVFFIILNIIGICSMLYVFSTLSLSKDISRTQFAHQAQSFLHDRVDVPKSIDTVDFNGKHYWHQEPFPSFVLIPGQLLFGGSFNEAAGQLFVLPFLVYFVYKLARVKGFRRMDAWFLTFAFLFASIMVNLITSPTAYYFAQVIATTLLTICVYEFETKKRYWVLGILEALIIATRPTASFIGLIIVFDVFYGVYRKGWNATVVKNIIAFFLPVITSISLLCYFNYIRFGNPFFNTYQASNAGPVLHQAQQLGVFSWQHIPSSLYYFFLASFAPIRHLPSPHLVFPFVTYSPLGFSFFLVCPLFLLAWKSIKSKNIVIRGYWIVIFTTLLLLLSFFGMGGEQSYGPRYTADFFPLLYVLLLVSIPSHRITWKHVTLGLCSASLNTYMLLTPYLAYYYGQHLS